MGLQSKNTQKKQSEKWESLPGLLTTHTTPIGHKLLHIKESWDRKVGNLRPDRLFVGVTMQNRDVCI